MFLSPSHLKGLRPGLVLLAATRTSQSKGGIWTERQFELRYPDLGLVWESNSREDILRGDLVIIENESKFIPRSYYDVFRVVLRDVVQDVVMTVDMDQEPMFLEFMRRYEASPSVWKHRWVELKDVTTDEVIKFNPPDVVEWGIEEAANPTYTLEYIPTIMIDLWTGEKFELFYIIDERKIIARIWREGES